MVSSLFIGGILDNILGRLNERQVEAVKSTDGPILIVAGAGSGKTRVITYKIAYLLASGAARPSDITAVTFTNKATSEMKNRIKEILCNDLRVCSESELRALTVSTFHSFCARVLRENYDKAGLPKNFLIYDSDDQRDLLSSILDNMKIDKKVVSPKDLVSLFSCVKNGMFDLRPNTEPTEIFQEYQKELKKANAVDFGDLLVLVLRIFSEHKDVLEYYQDRAKYFFVDEYQDTNRIQYKLIKLLSLKHRNICVVGDEDQSIYKWRGADIKNILDFEKDFKDAKVVKLEENYRSTSNIIGASSSLISKNTQRKAKTLFTKNHTGEKISLASLVNDIKEAEHIVEKIRDERRAGADYKDMAIFYRINAQSRLVEEYLRKNRVPYKIVGGTRFYDRKEIRDLVAYLKLCVSPDDGVSLQRVINTPTRGIGKTTMEKIAERANQTNKSMFAVMANEEDLLSVVNKSTAAKTKSFVELINKVHELNTQGTGCLEIAKFIIDSTGYIDFLRERDGFEADERVDNISELLSAMAEFEDSAEEKNAASFLESISLLGDIDQEEGSEEGVKLMTLHSAKGLEFKIVFIQGVEYGLLPYVSYGDNDANDLEEERRLLYVGMTRAMKKLYLSWSRSRRIFGGIRARVASDFLEEIDEKYMEKYSDEDIYFKTSHDFNFTQPLHTPVSIPTGTTYSSRTITYDSGIDYSGSGELAESVGSKVRHSMYGEGIIRSVEGRGEKAKVTVHFRNYGVKKLIWGYANLTIYDKTV